MKSIGLELEARGLSRDEPVPAAVFMDVITRFGNVIGGLMETLSASQAIALGLARQTTSAVLSLKEATDSHSATFDVLLNEMKAHRTVLLTTAKTVLGDSQPSELRKLIKPGP